MTEPITPSAFGLTAAGVTLFGVATGLDPALLCAGAAGGWWAMTYQPVLGALDRVSRVSLSALVGGWGSPVAVGYAAGTGWLPDTVPTQIAGFPVGAIYITADNNNPGTFLGGTWAQIAAGRTLIGVGTLGSDTYGAGAEGGAARVTLGINEIPSHNHGGATGTVSNDHTHSGWTSTTGGHNHTGKVGGAYGGSYFGSAGFEDAQGTPDWQAVDMGWAGDHAHSFTTSGISANHTHSISAQGGARRTRTACPTLPSTFGSGLHSSPATPNPMEKP